MISTYDAIINCGKSLCQMYVTLVWLVTALVAQLNLGKLINDWRNVRQTTLVWLVMALVARLHLCKLVNSYYIGLTRHLVRMLFVFK